MVGHSFALSLLGRVPPGADGEVPLLSVVLGADRHRSFLVVDALILSSSCQKKCGSPRRPGPAEGSPAEDSPAEGGPGPEGGRGPAEGGPADGGSSGGGSGRKWKRKKNKQGQARNRNWEQQGQQRPTSENRNERNMKDEGKEYETGKCFSVFFCPEFRVLFCPDVVFFLSRVRFF